MPAPNNVVQTEVVTWVDFRFSEVNESELVFVEVSVKNTSKVFQALRQMV
jgi:hypothetical protein